MNEQEFKNLKKEISEKSVPKSEANFLIEISKIQAAFKEVSKDYFKKHVTEKLLVFPRFDQIKIFNSQTNFDKLKISKDQITKKLAANKLLISQQYFNRVSRKLAASDSKISLEKLSGKNYVIVKK